MKRLLKIIDAIEPMKKTKENPFFKSNYMDINELLKELKPIFRQEGLVISQPLTNVEGRPAIATIVYDMETGKPIYLDTITLPDLQDAQKMGGAFTYFRRHSLKSLLGLEEIDDDGNIASGKEVPKTPQNTPQTPPKGNYVPHTKQPFGKNEEKFIEGMDY